MLKLMSASLILLVSLLPAPLRASDTLGAPVAFTTQELSDYQTSKAEANDSSASGIGPLQLRLLKTALFEKPDEVRFKSVAVASQNPKLQYLVDVYGYILFSQRMQKEFCPYMRTPELVTRNFGINGKTARWLALENCALYGFSNEKTFDRAFDSKVSREIVFIETMDTPPVESWTSARGDIYFFHQGQLDTAGFSRALIHEYFVGYDTLWNFDETNFQILLGPKFKFKASEPEIRSFMHLFQLSLIRGTFQYMRSLNFEQVILAENSKMKPSSSPKKCWARAKQIASLLAKDQDLYAAEVGIFMSRERRRKTFGTLSVAVFDELERMEKALHASQSICKFLAEPKIGHQNIRSTMGPRPRIGSGTQKTTSENGTTDFKTALPKQWARSFE